MPISDYIRNALDPMNQQTDKQILVDEVHSGLAYFGVASYDALTSAASWRVGRILKSGNIFETKYANVGGFDQIWNNRAALFGTPAFSNLNSIQFDGVNDFLSAPHSTNLNFERTNTFSQSYWVKFNTVGVSQFILSKRENTGNVRGWQTLYTTGTGVGMILSSTNVGNRINVTGPVLLANVWYHIVWTYSGNSLASGIKLYINSVNTALVVAENTLTTTIQTTVTTQMGSRDSGTTNFLNGKLDEVAIYGIELNQSQVNAIYNSGVPLDISQLSTSGDIISWWRMGDGDTFPTILDNKDSNHMTMFNDSNSDIITDVP